MIKTYKDKLFSFIRTAIVLFLAVIMFYFFLPVGLVPEPVPDDAEGELVRIMPDKEIYSDRKDDDNLRKIGKNYSAYYSFNIERFLEYNLDEINSVRVRFSFLKGSGATNNSIKVYALPSESNPEETIIASVPYLFEQFITEFNPYTKGIDDNLCEIDLTEYVKKQLKIGQREIKLKLIGENEHFVMMADAGYDDPMYKPCMKVATGKANDTEGGTLKRADLREAVYVSADNPDKTGNELVEDNALKLGGGNEIYLKFDINESTILGSLHNVILSLNKYDVASRRVKVYCINNNEWTGSSISYNMRPRGDESTAFTELSAPTGVDGRVSFDVTQAVCEARKLGITSLTFRIVCEDNAIGFSGKEAVRFSPHLYLKASDNNNIKCASDAALSALGTNRAAFVTMNLNNEYVSEDGTSAKIRWFEYETNGDESVHKHINTDGQIIRPKWFEGDDEILAVAEIRSGKYITKRQFSLKIPAEVAPDYSKYKFGNYIDIGNEKKEEAQKFDGINISGVHRRWTDARMFTYRTIEKGGIMLLNFSCVPGADNYITLKMWEGDEETFSNYILTLCGENKEIVLKSATETEIDDGGFVYLTYALPREFTEGKSFVSFALSYEEKAENKKNSSRGIYAAYITQSPFFDPASFSEQGEKPISEPFFGEGAREKFLENLGYLSINSDIEKTENDRQIVNIDPENGTIVFMSDEFNIAFSVDKETNKAFIYQKLEYYDRVCEGCPVIEEDDILYIDYGEYKLVWNKSLEQKNINHEKFEISGEYKDVVSGEYYTFSEDWQMTDDSVIPDGKKLNNGKEIDVEPGNVVLLSHIADPLHSSDWRVSKINGRNVSELIFGNNEKIEDITVKSVGGLSNEVDDVYVLVAIYENEKIVSIGRTKINVIGSMEIYTADMSMFDIYMQKGLTMRIFVYDDTESLVKISPKYET